ncbi:FAD-binding domain-containing protein [Salipiger bermudensis]|uniref:FAD-binding domain-containing protein n=1 Tax=Salipiger bermudensis TaxID=344736 RepID=UPI0028F74AFF|nr:FAD-binding domain-containing protein [Salipiger bermudensis]
MTATEATRDAALRRLGAFQPRMGRDYAELRNFDLGAGAHDHVSTLSPYLRRRLLTERETIAAALEAHGPEAAGAFIAEVAWRSYFKGWLEQRPQVWDAYRDGLARDLAKLERDAALRARVAQACEGRTGIAGFDEWAAELNETGYLHNHARMWFASIWIFTLKLPWRLGADFFLRQLLDGDPASNTCSWRWVAGLHTRGKHYEAQAANIARFTRGRVQLPEDCLAQATAPLDAPLPERQALRPVSAPRDGVPTLLLLTEEECQLSDFAPERLDLRGVLGLKASALRSPLPVAQAVCRFEAAALEDSAGRLGAEPAWDAAGDPVGLVRHAQAVGAAQIATGYIPTGPLHDWITAASPALEAAGIALTEWRRDWDALVWPHATAGFFKLRKQLPHILSQAGLT